MYDSSSSLSGGWLILIANHLCSSFCFHLLKLWFCFTMFSISSVWAFWSCLVVLLLMPPPCFCTYHYFFTLPAKSWFKRIWFNAKCNLNIVITLSVKLMMQLGDNYCQYIVKACKIRHIFHLLQHNITTLNSIYASLSILTSRQSNPHFRHQRHQTPATIFTVGRWRASVVRRFGVNLDGQGNWVVPECVWRRRREKV